MMAQQITPKLDVPGAGIPWFERTIAGFLIFNFRLKKQVDTPFLRINYKKSLKTLMESAEVFPVHLRERQILIPRLRGLEDSSRFYSPAMVLEHIALVDNSVSEIITLLGRRMVPPHAPSTADVKPTPGVTWLEAYQKMVLAAENFLEALSSDFSSDQTLPHPWFGPLTAWQWAQFTVIHHGIHLTQLQTIERRSLQNE